MEQHAADSGRTWRTGQRLHLCYLADQVLAQAEAAQPRQRQQVGLHAAQPVSCQVQALRAGSRPCAQQGWRALKHSWLHQGSSSSGGGGRGRRGRCASGLHTVSPLGRSTSSSEGRWALVKSSSAPASSPPDMICWGSARALVLFNGTRRQWVLMGLHVHTHGSLFSDTVTLC